MTRNETKLNTNYVLIEAPHFIRIIYSLQGYVYRSQRYDPQCKYLSQQEIDQQRVRIFIERWFLDAYSPSYILFKTMQYKAALLTDALCNSEMELNREYKRLVQDWFCLGVICNYIESSKVDVKSLLKSKKLLEISLFHLIESNRLYLNYGNLEFYKELATQDKTAHLKVFSRNNLIDLAKNMGLCNTKPPTLIIKNILNLGIIIKTDVNKYKFSSLYLRKIIRQSKDYYLLISRNLALKNK